LAQVGSIVPVKFQHAMAPMISRVFRRRHRKRQDDISVSVETFLKPYGFLASGAQEWQSIQNEANFSIRISNHAELDGHTQYHIECSIRFPAEGGSHFVHTWALERRLSQFRAELHDPLKRELAGDYPKLFHNASFARRGGLSGTTARLNGWLARLAQCVNSRTVPPTVVALVLTALKTPGAPNGGEPCASPMQLTASVAKIAKEAERPSTGEPLALRSCASQEPQTAPVPTMASTFDKDETWSELGLSDADSLKDACENEETDIGRALEAAVDGWNLMEESAYENTDASVDRLEPQVVMDGSVDISAEVALRNNAAVVPAPSESEYDSTDDVSDAEFECNQNANSACLVPDPPVATSLELCSSSNVPATDESIVLKAGLPHGDSSPRPDTEDKPKWGVQLRRISAEDVVARSVDDESKFKVPLRRVRVEEPAQVKPENSLLAKMRARKEQVDWQKMSGRGKVF